MTFPILFLAPLVPGLMLGQTDSASFSFFPPHLSVLPFVANHEEARLGLQQQFGSSRLNIGIGVTMDAIEYASEGDTLRWGPDLYSYALSSTIQDVQFKIAAADGFFGMHLTYTSGSAWSFRFRAMHQSAHLVDGSYDVTAGTWNDGRVPFNFTRNYGEVDVAYEARLGHFPTRIYSGLSGAVWNRPEAIRPVSAMFGIECHSPGTPAFYFAYNLSLMGIPSYVGSNNLEAGLKLGEWSGRGVRIYLSYYCGLDTFGAYYNVRREFAGAGFTFDLW